MILFVFITKNHDRFSEMLRTNHYYVDLLKSNIAKQVVVDLENPIGINGHEDLANFYDIPYDNSMVLAYGDRPHEIVGKWIDPKESDINEMCHMAEQFEMSLH